MALRETACSAASWIVSDDRIAWPQDP